MADDTAIADLFDSLSPLSSAGINPDEAVTDRAGTMAKLLGPTAPKSWAEQAQDQYQAQNDGPDQSNLSPNGNALPPGLNSRTASPSAAAATPTPDGPTAAVPASVTPSGATARPSLADNNAALISNMQSDYAKASKDVDNEANQPDLASTTKNLESARQNAAQPINAYDPKTGKLVDEYKPTFGQRIMRGVEGFAKKGVIGAVDPAAAGTTPYGAPNQQYGRDLNSQGQRVASIDQQLKNAADNWKSQSDRLKAIAADRRSVVTSGEGAARASNEQQAVPIKQQEADTGSQNADTEGQRATEAARHNKADEANTSAYQQGELKVRNGELGVSQSHLALDRQKEATAKGDPNLAAQLLVNGDATLSELKARGSTPEFIAQTLDAAHKLSGGKYNSQSADAQFSVAKSPTNVAFFGSAKSLTDPGGTLEQLADAAKAIPGHQIPVFNSIADAEKAATGSGPVAKYAAILLGVSDDYAKVMGGGSGSDTSRAQALKLVPANASPEARAQAIEGIRGTVNSQIKSRVGSNKVLQRMYAPEEAAGPTASGGHDIVVKPEDLK